MQSLFIVSTFFIALVIFALAHKKNELSKTLFTTVMTIFLILEVGSIGFLIFFTFLGYNA